MNKQDAPERIHLAGWPEYRERHAVCPRCHGEDIEQTTLGFVLAVYDTNRASCSCGWKGIVDDLVPNPNKETQ